MMKFLFSIFTAIAILTIVGCTNSPNTNKINKVENHSVLSQQQINAFEKALPLNEKKLWQFSQRNLQDTFALAQLADIHYKGVEENESLATIKKAIISHQLLFQRKPGDNQVAYRYYRLHLFLGFYEKHFDVAYWTSFFKQHPFLKNYDIAPPAYVAYLSSQPDKLDNHKKLAYLSIAYRQNPNFTHGKVELAKLYSALLKHELGLYLFEQTQKTAPNNPVVLFNFNQLRFQYIYSKCHVNSENLTTNAIKDAKKLIKLVPESPTGHYQLSLALRYKGQKTLAKFHAQKAAEMSADYQYNLYLTQLWNGNSAQVISALLQNKNKHLTVDQKRLLIIANIQQQNWQQVVNLVEDYINEPQMDFFISVYGIYAHQYLHQPEQRDLLIKKLTKLPHVSTNKKQLLAYINKKISKEDLKHKASIHCYDNKIAMLNALELLANDKTEAFYQALQNIRSLQVYSSEEYAIASYWLKANE